MSDKLWEEREICYISLIKQGTDEWKELRHCSISSSNISECVDRSSYSSNFFQTKEEKKKDLAMILCGLKTKKFSDEAIANMARGTQFEPFIREYHFNELRKSGLNCD